MKGQWYFKERLLPECEEGRQRLCGSKEPGEHPLWYAGHSGMNRTQTGWRCRESPSN